MLVWLLQRSEPTPHDNDGKQRLLRTGIIAKILATAGHDVIWWTSTFDHNNRRQRFSESERIQVSNRYSIQYIRTPGYKKNKSFARLRTNQENAKAFTKILRNEISPPDIIIASIPTAELAREAIRFAKPRGIPVILDVRDLWPDYIIESAPALLKPLAHLALSPLTKTTRWVFQNADAIIGLTDEFVDWGLKYANRKRKEFDRVFAMGYIKRALTFSEKQEGEEFWQSQTNLADNEKMNVVYVGSMSRSLDLNTVIEAAELLEKSAAPIRFILCGDGEQFTPLLKKKAALNNVCMPGWINDIQIRTLLEYAHIGIAPYVESANFINNLPNKPAEYLSSGLAIATSLSSGPLVTLINKYSCGFSYMNEAHILAENLPRFLNKTKRSKTRENALQVFESFLDGEKIYTDMVRYLEDIVQKHNISRTRTAF